MALTKITSTNIQPGAIESSSLETSGATAGTYGSASQIPVLSVNAQGIVYAISETTVAGVTNFAYDSGTEVLTISTADGGSFTADVSSLASQTYVDTALANLIDSAPGALDTLNELAAAIGDDANFAATVTNSLATKVDKINITGATVGSSTQIPVITYNAQGQITSTTTTAVAGINSVTFTNGTLTIAAGDGTNYTTDFDARYFTETEANSNFLGINAKAADADLFDGLNSTQFLRSDSLTNLTSGGIKFYDNSLERGRLLADASLYIGTSTPSSFWDIRNNSGNAFFALDRTNNRVGIGTATPTAELDVRGNITQYGSTSLYSDNGGISFSKTSSISSTNQDYYGGILRIDISGYHYTSDQGGFASAANDLALMHHGNLAFATTSATGNNTNNYPTGRMIILENGNVGIGTRNPTEKLEVNGILQIRRDSDHPALRFAEINSGTTTTRGYIASGDWAVNGGAIDDFGISSSTTGDLLLATNAGTERLRIQSNTGNVGIGTNNPLTTLHVEKAVSGDFISTFQNTNSSTPYGVWVKDAASPANGYPLLQVTDAAGTGTYFRVDSGTGNIITNGVTLIQNRTETGYASNLAETVSKATLKVKTHYSDSTLTTFGAISGGDAYIQRSNGPGTGSYNIRLNPYGGAVLMPKQPSFRAYLSTEWTTINATINSGWTTQYDRGNNFNQGTFTAPVAGSYFFSVMWDSLSTQGHIDLRVNDQPYARWEPTGRTDNAWESHHYSSPVYLQAGDYVTLYATGGGGSNPFHMGAGHWGHFGGYLIG